MSAQDHKIHVKCYHNYHRGVNTPATGPPLYETGQFSVRYSLTGYENLTMKKNSGPLPFPIVPCRQGAWCKGKCFVRPLAVHVYNVHAPQVLKAGWKVPKMLPPEEALFKHIRCQDGWRSALMENGHPLWRCFLPSTIPFSFLHNSALSGSFPRLCVFPLTWNYPGPCTGWPWLSCKGSAHCTWHSEWTWESDELPMNLDCHLGCGG